jgi:hypothetical protein
MPFDLDKIKQELESLPEYRDQICLQGTHDNLDPFLGIGKLKNIQPKYEETDFVFPIFDLPYVNSIMKDLKLFRTRVMLLLPSRCYTYHYDYSPRIHIPIKTNKRCFIVEDGRLKHLPADGNYYLVDTTKWHTALNGSAEDRIHIVGGITNDT